MGAGQDHRRRPRAAPRPGFPGLKLGPLLDRLAAGEHPAADWSISTLPAPHGARAIVVGGTAWHVVAADADPEWVTAQLAVHRWPLGARFLAALADRVGAEPGPLDAVLVAPPPPAAIGVTLVPAEVDHPRVARARAHRTDVRVFATPDGAGLITLGRGVGGRWEIGLEVDPAARGRGLGTALVAAAPALVPDGAPLWAQVATANVASLRAFLAAGWRHVAAEVLFAPAPDQL